MSRALFPALFAIVLSGCVASTHPTQRASLGTSRPSSDLLAVINEPGPIQARTIVSADWAVARSGVLNLEHPEAKKAGLQDGDESIHVFFHALKHPQHGTFILDTGVERALRDAPKKAAVQGFVADVMKMETLKVHVPLADWIEQQPEPLAGVLMSHLHLDHVTGMPDVPRGTPIYAGPGETGMRSFQNLLVAPNIDRALAGQAPVSEWAFEKDADGRFEGLVDVFGDGSLWAIWTPGHTAGSTAYLARTTEGPVLYTGDNCHTAWGWDHDVEPGEFTADRARNADSLARLRQLAREFPAIQVRLGHQHPAAAAHP